MVRGHQLRQHLSNRGHALIGQGLAEGPDALHLLLWVVKTPSALRLLGFHWVRWSGH